MWGFQLPTSSLRLSLKECPVAADDLLVGLLAHVGGTPSVQRGTTPSMVLEPAPVTPSSARRTLLRGRVRVWLLRLGLIGSGVALIAGSAAFLLAGPMTSSAESSGETRGAGDGAAVLKYPGLDGLSLTSLRVRLHDTLGDLDWPRTQLSDGVGGDSPASAGVGAPEPSPARPPRAPVAPTATSTAVPPTPVPPLPTSTPVPPTPVPPPPTATPVPPTPVPPPPTAAPPPPTATYAPPPPPASVALTLLEQRLYDAINAERAGAGLSLLSLDPALQGLARERSQDMASRGYFSHTTPEGKSVFDLMAERGIPFGWAGENLARNNYPDAESAQVAIRDLMASSAHRANILHPNYITIGVGLAIDSSGMKYFTMIFVGPA